MKASTPTTGEGMANSSHYAQVSSTLLEAAWQVNCCRQGSHRGEAAYTIYKMKWPVKKGGQLYIVEEQEPATLFSALDSMAAMTQVLALIMDGEQGSDWRGNWWPQMDAGYPPPKRQAGHL